MKKILSAILTFCILFSFVNVFAQATFTVPHDTVVTTINKAGSPGDDITNITGNDLTIKWSVVSCNFTMDWLTPTAFGICDDNACYNNSANYLWNKTTGVGNPRFATYRHNTLHDSTSSFGLSMNLAAADTIGTAYVTINLKDTVSGYNKDITFIVTKNLNTVNVNQTISMQNDILLYPNPASGELNVIYDEASEVKNIAVYNIIGKVMAVYKVNGNSANLNLENIPSGIYFVRLYNNSGNVVATRKFTRQ